VPGKPTARASRSNRRMMLSPTNTPLFSCNCSTRLKRSTRKVAASSRSSVPADSV